MTYGGRWYRVPVFDGIWYEAELVGVTVGRYLSEWLIMHVFRLLAGGISMSDGIVASLLMPLQNSMSLLCLLLSLSGSRSNSFRIFVMEPGSWQ